MLCIVTYDIKVNKIRTKLVRYLVKRKGIRLQKSVFAVLVERHVFKLFLNDIRKITGEKDLLAVFRLCKGCQKNAIQLTEDEKPVFIF